MDQTSRLSGAARSPSLLARTLTKTVTDALCYTQTCRHDIGSDFETEWRRSFPFTKVPTHNIGVNTPHTIVTCRHDIGSDFETEWRRSFPFTSTGRQWEAYRVKATTREEARAKV